MVRYGRSIQPKPYESKEALLEAHVMADPDGEVNQLEIDAVFKNLVDKVHAVLRGGASAAPEAPVDNSAAEPAKKTRTRRTKQQIADDKAAAEQVDEVPIDGAPGVVDNSGKDVPIDGAEGDSEVSDTDLQSASAKAAAKHGPKKVKELLAEYGVALLGKLTQDQRVGFLVKLDAIEA